MKLKHLTIQVAALTHRGSVRDHNEDAVAVDKTVITGNEAGTSVWELTSDTTHVLMVADGMGGHASGELASRTALEALISKPSFFESQLSCANALVAANEQIYELMLKRPETRGMGTTIVGVALMPEALIHFNVGDSRAYRHATAKLKRLSVDDVPSSSTNSRRRSHLITQSLGGQASRVTIMPHVATASPSQKGETLLLCSDGLTDMVGEEDLLHVLNAASDARASAQALVELSLRAGGHDNVSVVVARAI